MCPHFNSLAEQAIIKKAIEANKVVIGVCLGSQLRYANGQLRSFFLSEKT
jgi:imidazoleglycerol phosphate synthase glutamine amidotransferase subunit HisH